MRIACNACGKDSADLLIEKDGFDVVRCRGCSLIYVGNPPDDAQRARMYSFEAGYHKELKDDQASEAFHAREAAMNLAVLRRHVQNGRLLDIGCSTGLFLKAARAIGWAGQGLEYSPDSSRIAREVEGLNVKTGELTEDTYAPHSFDVVTMWDVIEHVPDPRRTLQLISRIVAPGGLLVLKTPDADGLFPRWSLMLAARLRYWRHAEPPGHLFQFSTRTLSAMAEAAGFEVLARHSQRIPVTYSFGPASAWFRSLKWAAYCAIFVPLAWIGPWLGSGDDIVIVLRRPVAA
jgi:2-polyprenyl-3-methyl-5-hydroxy-6-metoxy-1,4-benzoquinol methylase